ncbi:4253c093-0271-42ac-bf29-7326d96f03c0 [Sclerotinia trifoliorum]|uniref:4253c093-0271-42ac-bf29-7326d96f03c0 n=1 Tax=Sclerotinia trifoliorum TaxID=28548 RepID=A0A8H2ZS49_9HELO|nr:4253c093-0271-42ac-bf29-7326d96f03c0 [Sclerotinia trifoliorum]
MPTGLAEFRLPGHVAERKAIESLPELDMDLSCSIHTQNSSASELPSPVTPTFSTRGHMRHPSSASSIESQYLYESPSSPTFATNKSGKRSLPDVQEEPRCERENDFMFEDDDDIPDCDELYNCLCDDLYCLHRDTSMAQSSVHLSTNQDSYYDLSDGFFSDGEFPLGQRYKKRRGNESPLNGLTSRFNSKFPSFARKWSARKATGSSAASISSDTQRDYATSRAPSSRSSSRSNSARRPLDDTSDLHLPPTPTRSVFGSRDNSSTTSFLDIEKAKSGMSEFEEGLAGTPLLPPLMTDVLAKEQFKMQSPLQSPSVADTSDSMSGANTPIDFMITQQLHGMPSPPLSTKPSISSFHRSTIRSNYIVPSSEIPAILIAEENDEWANKLGHANFVIHPEPYVPENFDLEACRQLRADWDLARCNYTKHIVRTGEHYGVTSKTYKLTEEKWAQTDLKWMKNSELTIATTAQSSTDAFATLKHNTLGNASSSNVMTKIPSLNDPRSEGKFPQLGDEDIVGPMVQATAQLRRNPSKTTKLLRFITDKFPVALGKP